MKRVIFNVDNAMLDLLEQIRKAEGLHTRTMTFYFLLKYYCWNKDFKRKLEQQKSQIPEVYFLSMIEEGRAYNAGELMEIFQKNISETLVILVKLEFEKLIRRTSRGYEKI